MRVFARAQRRLCVELGDLPALDGGTSLVLLAVAILFLRNQIKPILRLADAAESFGKGREVPNFRPRGAREVRRAAAAFIEMKARVERAIEQRTTMLAGVSHDLRTVLTRFKLELALIGDSARSRGDEEGRRRDGAACSRPISRSRAAIAASSRRRPTWRPSSRSSRPTPSATATRRDGGVPRPADRHGAAGRVQALPRQSGLERGALCRTRSPSPAIATIAGSP